MILAPPARRQSEAIDGAAGDGLGRDIPGSGYNPAGPTRARSEGSERLTVGHTEEGL
jgi:hypothetical protein